MRIYQYLPDEQKLWNYLQEKEYDKAIEIVDWYYSPKNSDGFDDPKEITRAEDIVIDKEIAINFEEPFEIKKSKGLWVFFLTFMLIILSFLTYLYSINKSLTFLIYAWSIMGILIALVLVQLLDKTSQITLSKDALEFEKSNKAPIQWNNILSLYMYYRQISGKGAQSIHFIIIWKKDSVKPEQFILNYLNYDPMTIFYVINKFKNEMTKNK